MVLPILREGLAVFGRLDIWLGALFWGALMLGGANFLAAGYTGPRRSLDAVLSCLMFFCIGCFLLLVGPAMVLKTAPPAPFLPVWSAAGQGHFTLQRAAVTFVIGAGFAVLTCFPPVVWAVPSRLLGCVVQAHAMLGSIVFFATEGSGRFVPGPLVLAGMAGFAAVFVISAQLLLGAILPRTTVRSWMIFSPILVAAAVAPYAGWLRAMNS